jgi:hypothetical protein
MSATTVFYQVAAPSPKPRRPRPVFVGRLWPVEEPEFLDVTGEPVAQAAAWHGLTRLLAAQKSPLCLPRVSVEPAALFDERKASALVDAPHEVRWFEHLHAALEAASPEEVGHLGEMLHHPSAPAESASEGGDELAEQTDWRQEFSERLKQGLRRFRPLFLSAWGRQPRLLQADVQRAGRVFAAPIPLKGELVESSRRALQEVRQAIRSHASAITRGMRPFATSYGSLSLAQHYAGGLTEASAVSVSSIEETFADPPDDLIEEIARRGPAVDVVLLEPLADFRLLDRFASACFGSQPRLHGMVYAGITDYDDEHQLLELARDAPPGEDVGQGHLCLYAGRVRHAGVGADVPVVAPLFGRRHQLDQMLEPGLNLWGVAEPLFGAQPKKLLAGLDSVDTLGWRDSLRQALAEQGVNCLAQGEGGVYPYRNRTRCTLPELLQADAVRLREFLAGNIRAYLGKVGPGDLSTPQRRRMLADGASQLWRPFGRLEGFNARLEPGDSSDPTQFVLLLQLPTYFGIEKVTIFFRAVNPTSPG